jgi:hypothetical protein
MEKQMYVVIDRDDEFQPLIGTQPQISAQLKQLADDNCWDLKGMLGTCDIYELGKEVESFVEETIEVRFKKMFPKPKGVNNV